MQIAAKMAVPIVLATAEMEKSLFRFPALKDPESKFIILLIVIRQVPDKIMLLYNFSVDSRGWHKFT